MLSHNVFAYCTNDPVNNEDQMEILTWWVGAAAIDSAIYLIQHRRGGATWKGLGKSSCRRSYFRCLFGGAGKLVSKGARDINKEKAKKNKQNRHRGYMLTGDTLFLLRMDIKH
ncbi:hypothetical protein Q5M85_02350 [Paraclostridium bifermentans]|nr:hypothetical protein [Paraclostridium bifermentans]